jgi:hypothetical protein
MNYKINPADRELVAQIGERFDDTCSRFGRSVDRLGIELDLIFCHLNYCQLNLERLLNADPSNFVHDVAGINQHIDRKTGHLKNCFWPRFAVKK